MENIKYEDLTAEEANATLEVEIQKEVMPVIQINFEELKTALNATLQEYKGFVVTDINLSTCKAKQRELAGVRTKLDTYRKDKKKKLSEPITKFENQIKELIGLVEQAEKPIKDGIAVFDNIKRDEKRSIALRIISEIAEQQGLNEKYSLRLEVLDKYCNLTIKESDVKTDVEQRAFALKVEQDREQELIEIIKSSIVTENERINTKLKFEDFKVFIDNNISTINILSEIKKRADRIYLAENPPIETPIENIVVEPVQPPITNEIQEKVYTAEYHIIGTQKRLQAVSEYLKINGITYKVVGTYEVE